MATKAEDIISGADLDSTANTAGINMDKHFEAAGIEAEPDATTDTTNTDPKAGEQAKPEAKAGEKSTTDKGTGDGNAKDDKSKLTPEQEAAKKAEPALNSGDLKLADGTIIKAGNERRLYETAQLERHRNLDLTNQLKQMTGSRDKHRDELVQLRQTVQSVNGAKPEEISIGLRIVRDLQRDPAGTLKNLLAEAVASGYTVEGVTSGLDAAAIKHLLENNAPQQQHQGPTEEQITQEAAQEAAQFFTEFPDARIHESLIARVAADHPTVSLKDVYFQLRQGAINRGLDWSKPLTEQVSANQQQQDTNQQQQNTKAMPNGRAVVDANAANKTSVAHESTDTGDIIKEAMREAGLNI